MALYFGTVPSDYNGELRRPPGWQPPDQPQVYYRPPAQGQSIPYGKITASGLAKPDTFDPRLHPPGAGIYIGKTKKSRKTRKSRRKSRRNRRRVKRKTRSRR